VRLRPNLRSSSAPTGRLTADEILRLNPYQLLAELDKNVIHPGGRRSTREMLEMAALDHSRHVLEVGCGVGATAIDIARRYGCRVTAVDYDPRMVERARADVARSPVADRVGIEHADVMALPFADELDCGTPPSTRSPATAPAST